MTPLPGSSNYGYTHRERERETYHHTLNQQQKASSHFYHPFCFMVMLKELFELLFITLFFLLLSLQWGSIERIMLPITPLRNMSCYSLGMICFNSKLLCLLFPSVCSHVICMDAFRTSLIRTRCIYDYGGTAEAQSSLMPPSATSLGFTFSSLAVHLLYLNLIRISVLLTCLALFSRC